jgi:uncharacterized YigZ family protein
LFSTFQQPSGAACEPFELVIKKSRFVGYCKQCGDMPAVQECIDELRREHPKSRHVCWAFVGGRNGDAVRSSDDGEPTGTAASPILTSLQREGLTNAAVFVVRYFGGTKLGAGGLIRAYGQAARGAIDCVERAVVSDKVSLEITLDGDDASSLGAVFSVAQQFSGETSTTTTTTLTTTTGEEKGNDEGARCEVRLDAAVAGEFEGALRSKLRSKTVRITAIK